MNVKYAKAYFHGSLTDVVEMDAASNNSVEDIRSIREEVNFLPTKAKYRVYIIDEVHMLSTGAFNALLKTLEEPPEHVKFVLATTEPQKLPATILSRCQRFDFKRISNEDIIKRLKIICENSNIQITENALSIIAILSEGAMRDAISILERCTGEDKGKIDENYVRELVGIPKTTQIYEIAKGILENNIEQALLVINNVINEGKDLDNFLWEIIKYIKDLLIYKATNTIEIYSDEEKKQMSIIVRNVPKERLLEIIYDLSKLANDIKWSSQKSIILQAGIINACIKKEEIKQTVANKNAETSIKSENIVSKSKEIKSISEAGVQRNEKANVQQGATTTKNSYWNNVINALKQNGKMSIYVNLIGSTAKELNDMIVEVKLANKNTFAKQILESHENKQEIEKLISKEFGKPMNVRFINQDDKKDMKEVKNPIENIANELDIPFNVIDE